MANFIFDNMTLTYQGPEGSRTLEEVLAHDPLDHGNADWEYRVWSGQGLMAANPQQLTRVQGLELAAQQHQLGATSHAVLRAQMQQQDAMLRSQIGMANAYRPPPPPPGPQCGDLQAGPCANMGTPCVLPPPGLRVRLHALLRRVRS